MGTTDPEETGGYPYLPAEISVKVFTLREGFKKDHKSIHSFIDVSEHLNKTKGLIGEITRHTSKYNKIPWDLEENWTPANWKKLWRKISNDIFKMNEHAEHFAFFTHDRAKTIECLRYIAEKADKAKDFQRLIRPGVTTWDVLCRAIFGFCNKINEERIDEETGMTNPDFSNYVDVNSDIQTKKWYQEQPESP